MCVCVSWVWCREILHVDVLTKLCLPVETGEKLTFFILSGACVSSVTNF